VDTTLKRSWEIVIDFLNFLGPKKSDIIRLVKKLKRESKHGAKDLKDLFPESSKDLPRILLRLRSEKLWEGCLGGTGRGEFSVEEIAKCLFKVAQNMGIRGMGREVSGVGTSSEKVVEQPSDADDSGHLTTAEECGAGSASKSQPARQSSSAPEMGQVGASRLSNLEPLFDSWTRPVVWDAAFEQMVMGSGVMVAGSPALGLFRTCLLECPDSEALVFARELIQKLVKEGSPKTLRALSQLFAVIGHGAPGRMESVSVFIAAGLMSEISIARTPFSPGRASFWEGEGLECVEQLLGDLQRDGCFAISAILTKAAAEREAVQAGERRLLMHLMESCKDATFEVLQSAYRMYTPAELPEGAAEAGFSTPQKKQQPVSCEAKLEPRKDVRDAARLGLLNLRSFLPESSSKYEMITSLQLAHDAIIADEAQVRATSRHSSYFVYLAFYFDHMKEPPSEEEASQFDLLDYM
jgi:hypothetical protein